MTKATDESLALPLIGESRTIQDLSRQIARVARTSLSVVIEGPTGSGKEVVARGLHVESRRRGRFVAFNVCAVAEGMFEDALFGHVRGAFSGAVADNAGYCEEANGGTLFLDEISALGLSQQAKLLRVVEAKSFRRVGGKADQYSDFRLISASNESLARLASLSKFRDDLRYRLAGVVIQVPPLAEHLEDIPALVHHFATRFAGSNQTTAAFSKRALDLLQSIAWPGNIRELKSVVERAIAFAATDRIGIDELHASLETMPQRVEMSMSRERRHILDTLIVHEWNTVAAAASLGINRSSLYRIVKRLGISKREITSDIALTTSVFSPKWNERSEQEECRRILPLSPSFSANERESSAAQEA